MDFYSQVGIVMQPIAEHFQAGLFLVSERDQVWVNIFLLSGLDRPSIDAWAVTVIERSQAWATRQQGPFLALHDFTLIPMLTAITPYLRYRSVETMKAVPYLAGRVAIVAKESPTVRAVGGRAAEYFMNRSMPKLTARVMYDPAEALEWLRQL